VLWDKRIKLDDNFKNSFIGEIIKVSDRDENTENCAQLASIFTLLLLELWLSCFCHTIRYEMLF